MGIAQSIILGGSSGGGASISNGSTPVPLLAAYLDPTADCVYVLDVSDTTDGPNGTLKRIPLNSAYACPSMLHFGAMSSDNTLVDDTSTQNIFPSAFDTFTATGSTSYQVYGSIALTKGSTSNTVSLSFGGTATYTSIGLLINITRGSNGVNAVNNTSAGTIWLTQASATSLGGANTNPTYTIGINGIIRVNAGGTIIPQLALSLASGGTYKILANSFLSFIPIGSNTVTAVGPFA